MEIEETILLVKTKGKRCISCIKKINQIFKDHNISFNYGHCENSYSWRFQSEEDLKKAKDIMRKNCTNPIHKCFW